jgi:acetyl-CoA carboxylase carboxyltransferase component
MSWDKEVQELQRRRYLAQQQGGEASIAKQHARGRMTIRERIDVLLDDGSFREHGRATASPVYDDHDELLEFVPANYVVGFGAIEGRRVTVGGEDFTLKGGSPNAAGLRKSVYAEHLAVQYRTPLVRMLEGGGGSVKGGGKKGGTVGDPVYTEPRFKIIADAMGVVPVASAALGAVAGFPAGRLVASHFSVMTEHTAQVLIGGPALVERALGVKMTKEELGGASVHLRSGIVDNLATDEHDALAQIRRFLSYLPSSIWQRTPRYQDG